MKTIAAIAIVFIYCNLAQSQTWIPSDAPTFDWAAVASSADGTRLVAAARSNTAPPFIGLVYISTNSGAHWTPTTAIASGWTHVASSADGSVLLAMSPTNILISTNFGSNWAPVQPLKETWTSIACSADGTRILVGGGSIGGGTPNLIYFSTNSGNNWTPTGPANGFDWSVASSADGNKLAAISAFSAYTSSDAGADWSSSNNINPPFPDIFAIASSADATHLEAGMGGNGGSFYTSSDFGVDWTSNNLPHEVWSSAASSADGSKLIAGCFPLVFTSTNFGLTWISNTIPKTTWSGVASSADGNKLVAVAFPGGIYTYQTPPSPQVSLSASNGALNFSWTAPSTNMVLQQSPDLITWTTLTNLPSFNDANLQNQVALPSSNNSDFFRLVSQ